MRKLYLLLPLAMLTTLAMGQIDFTFEVDMNGETVSANGVHVAGNFQDEAGAAGDWDPGTTELTDDDVDGIYSLTVNIPAGGYEYKFINGNIRIVEKRNQGVQLNFTEATVLMPEFNSNTI